MSRFGSHTTIIGPYPKPFADQRVDSELDAWERAADQGEFRIIQVVIRMDDEGDMRTTTLTVRFESLRLGVES